MKSIVFLRILTAIAMVSLVFSITAFAAVSSEMNVRALGAAGDGASDDTPYFRRALNSIGDAAATVLIADGVFVVESLVFPPNVTLSFRNGGQLSVTDGHVLTVNGRIDADMRRIFAGGGSVSGNTANLHIYPQWFGAAGDGVTDDARALQQAADLAAACMGRTLFIPDGVYLINQGVTIRSNVENRGLFLIELEIDEDRTTFCNDLFLPTHYPKHAPVISFTADHPEQELSPEPFYGIREGMFTVPVFQQIPLADGSGAIDLEEGGTLRFYSSEFFSSRQVRKGDHYYDKNDICQVVSGRGGVFPEFAFDYGAPADAGPWDEHATYGKGDYCAFGGEVFKATWASGPGVSFRHSHLGEVKIGAVQPDPASDSTSHHYTYEAGAKDSMMIWRRVYMRVWYRNKDKPATVNGLRVEVRLKGHGGETKRIAAGAMSVTRSNMTFNNLEISVRDREATMSKLLQASGCVNNTFNNGYFSGATCAHLGYNILNSNVANFRYTHCISTNSRKGMDGRHGKNIHVNGGYYNIIDDHYGRNYFIRDVTMSGMSVHVPNDSTPRADLQAWEFSPRPALGFNGANFHIENVIVAGGASSVMSARTDIGDLYGVVVLRDVALRGNSGDVQLFEHTIHPFFDYAHEVRRPDRLTVENITMENPGAVRLAFGGGFGELPYGPVYVRNAPISQVFTASPETHFSECAFDGAKISPTKTARIHFRNCRFIGENTGLTKENVAFATGNSAENGASCSFPINHDPIQGAARK